MTEQGPDIEALFAVDVAAFFRGLPLDEMSTDEVSAAIGAYGRVIAAQITASATAASSLRELVGGIETQKPDDADVMTYDLGASVLLNKTRGKVVLISDEYDDGKLTIKWARDVNGKSTVHTVVMSDDGIAQ